MRDKFTIYYGGGLIFGFIVAFLTDETWEGLVGLSFGLLILHISYSLFNKNPEKVLFCEQCKILTFSTSDKELKSNANIHTIANPDHVTYIGEKIELNNNKA